MVVGARDGTGAGTAVVGAGLGGAVGTDVGAVVGPRLGAGRGDGVGTIVGAAVIVGAAGGAQSIVRVRSSAPVPPAPHRKLQTFAPHGKSVLSARASYGTSHEARGRQRYPFLPGQQSFSPSLPRTSVYPSAHHVSWS